MLNFLPKVSSLLSPLVINLMKIKIQIFQTDTWPHVGHLIKGSCLGALLLRQHLAYCSVDTSYAGGDVNLICHVTQQDHSVEMPREFMGENSSQHVTTLKSLVTIVILIVKRKILHQKHEPYKYVLSLKNGIDWITTQREKTQTQKWYILRRSV